jgi:hypothetical protein
VIDMGRLLDTLRVETGTPPPATVATPATKLPKSSRVATVADTPASKTTESGTRGVESDLHARCKTACESLPIQPAELFEALDAEDLAANPSPESLRAFAESIAERKPKPLPAGVSRAYTRLGRTLVETPSLRFACESLPDEGGDYALLAVGVKDAGFAVLRMPKEKFGHGFLLIEMVDRWNNEARPK